MDILIRRWELVAAVTILSLQGLSAAFSVVCPDGPAVVMVGADVLLKCHLDPRLNAAGMEVRWFRSVFTEPVALYQQGAERTDGQIPEYRGRAELIPAELPKGNLHLLLRNVRLSDEGTFMAFVQSDDHFSEYLIQLKVAALGDLRVLMDDNSQGRALVCKSSGWHPAPIVRWMAGGSPIEATWKTTEEQSKGGSFSVESYLPLPEGHGRSFTCILQNPLLGTELSMDITVSDPLPGWAIFLIFLAVLLPVSLVIYGVYRRQKQKDKHLLTIYQSSLEKYGGRESEPKLKISKTTGAEGLALLIPLLQKSTEICLSNRNLKASHCRDLASVLRSNYSLRDLNLGGNKLTDKGLKALCEGLKQPDCMLQKLELTECHLTAAGMVDLSAALKTNRSLRELTLSHNQLKEKGVKRLCEGLKEKIGSLETLRLTNCSLTKACCDDLSSLLSSHHTLVELELWCNKLEDSGARTLCEGLTNESCTLRILGLLNCFLTSACGATFADVFRSNRTLRELNLNSNKIEDSGMKLLCDGLKNPEAKLERLRLSECDLTDVCMPDLCSLLSTNLSLRKLDLSNNKLEGSRVTELCEALKRETCKVHKVNLLGNRMSLEAKEQLEALEGIDVSTE